MWNSSLEKLLKLVEKKYYLDKSVYHWEEVSFYLSKLEDEIKEVKDEIKENNSIYLEDELSDIFRCYLNFLKRLEKDWYIDSLENVLIHCEKKYSKRIEDKEIWINWEETKKKQKEELLKEHNLKYNKNTWK